jgi:hypothetical protein
MMTDNDLQSQLEALKQQVVDLSAARQEAADSTVADSARSSGDSGAVEPTKESEARQPLDQIEELVRLLEKELRDNPLASGLAIFIAGLLAGRLLR